MINASGASIHSSRAAMPIMLSNEVNNPSRPSASNRSSDSMSEVIREIRRPDVYPSWNDTDRRCACRNNRCRSSNSTSWPSRPERVMKANWSTAETIAAPA